MILQPYLRLTFLIIYTYIRLDKRCFMPNHPKPNQYTKLPLFVYPPTHFVILPPLITKTMD